MNKLLLSFALFLHGSKRYRSTKAYIRDSLTNVNNPNKKYIDITIIFLIVTSVFILIYEVKNPVPEWFDIYDIYFVSFVFAVEYLLRLWVYSDLSEDIIQEYNDARYLHRDFSVWDSLKTGLSVKLQYMLTPAALIDLLAILPAYRPLRVLRIFVLFRVLKLLRYTKSIKQFLEVLSNKKFELLTLLFLLVFIVMVAGIAIYVVEEKLNPNIESLFDAIYWSLVTISSVGYGDIAPVTDAGRSISMFIIISGIAMISFSTSVIVSAFSEKLSELKENRIIEQINKNKSFLLICGYGQLSKMFFRQSETEILNYIILEKNPEKVQLAIKDGYRAIHEDASRYDTLKKFNTDHADITMLCLADNDVENIYISLNAKSISHKIKVIARASSPAMVSKFKYAGVDHVLLPNVVANTMIYTAITQPTLHKAIHAILTGKNIARIDEVHVNYYPIVIGKNIEALHLKKNKLLFLGIKREGKFMFNPPLDTSIEDHDILLVMGRQISLEYFEMQYAGDV